MTESLILEYKYDGENAVYLSADTTSVRIPTRLLQEGLSNLGREGWYIAGMSGTTKIGQPRWIFMERELDG